MQILAPVNSPQEVKQIIQAGASQIYCGLLDNDWQAKFSNVASTNRREWKTANLSSFHQLQEVIQIAHDQAAAVYLTLNALYTRQQYPLLLLQAQRAQSLGIDALIVADLGLLLSLKQEGIKLDIHISTGATVFNSQTAKFYQELGASRITLPRHLRPGEMAQIIQDCPELKFDAFILNSGCKNIDGFCTFHHGINEVLHRQLWNLPKKLNLDRHLLGLLRRLPKRLAQRISGNIFGIDSACLLNYKVSFTADSATPNDQNKRLILKNIASWFSLFSGIDTCGACRLREFQQIGIDTLKIVGRNYSTKKKISDVKFLKSLLSKIEEANFSEKEFSTLAQEEFRKNYKLGCNNLCYYPDGN